MTEDVGHWNVLAMHLDTVHYPDWHPRAGDYGPVYAYLLDSDELVVLVDTGIGPAHELIDRLYEPTRQDLVTALARNHGVAPADIDAIIVSHLHFDHIGGAQAFPGLPLVVQRAEWEAAHTPKYTIPEWLTFEGANFQLVDGDTEFAPGLRLVATPGHTPGHQSVALETTAGTVVLAGQAIETRAELEAMLQSGELTDDAQRLLSLEPVRILFSHDHRTWEPTDPSRAT